MEKPQRHREVPWCALFLVTVAIIAHTITLIGNLETAETFVTIGKATGGWSDVGLGVSESMIYEMEMLMDKTAKLLTDGLEKIIAIDTMLTFVLGSAGNITQQGINLMQSGDEQAIRDWIDNPVAFTEVTANDIPGMPMHIITHDAPKLFSTEQLDKQKLAALRKPLKEAIEEKVKAVIQKLCDSVDDFWKMMKPALLQVGKWLHSMGKKMQGFIEQFSQTLDKAQKIFDQVMAKLSGPDPIKEKMVFNTFNIFDVHHRQAISVNDIKETASLFGVTALSGAKGAEWHKKYDLNKDGFLEIDEYYLAVDDPSVPGVMAYVLRIFSKKLSQIAGQLKGAKMRDEVAECTTEFFQLMMAKNLTKTKWVSNAITNGSLPIQFSAAVFKQLVEQDKAPDKLTDLPVGCSIIGFMVEMAPDYVQKILKEAADPDYWAKQGYEKKTQKPTIKTLKAWIKANGKCESDDSSLLQAEMETDASTSEAYKALISYLDELTDEVMDQKITEYHAGLRRERMRVHQEVMHAPVTRVFFKHLLHDITGKAPAVSPDVAAVTKGGVLALPATMKWKALLVDNATQTSQAFQHFSFKYAKTSSNPIDNFANQIQAFIKKVEQFLDLMMEYTTPKGIHNIHMKIDDFVHQAAKDVNEIVDRILSRTGLDEEGSIPENVDERISALALGTWREHGPEDAVVDGVVNTVFFVFHVVKDLLDLMKSFLPTVISDIKFAKKEVSSVASTLKSIFAIFKDMGGKLFDEIADTYASIWTMYYLVFVFLTTIILFYAFWAYDWFKPDEHTPRQPSDNMALECCCGFLDCLRDCQDSALCFWSCILVSEVVILIMFCVGILFCIIAGIKAFIAFGCAQIYVLGDNHVCTNIMVGLSSWMETFWKDMPSSIEDACESDTLVACEVMAKTLMSSAKQTVIGSFVAAFFSLQMIFLSAKLHERARYNHVIEKMIDQEENPHKYNKDGTDKEEPKEEDKEEDNEKSDD
jgi:uncharacterized protein YoxC